MYRLHQDLCCMSTYVDLVISNLWTNCWSTTYFCSVSLYVVGFQTNHWCCNNESSIFPVYILTAYCMFIYNLFFLIHITEPHSKLYTQRFVWPTTTQSKEYLCWNGVPSVHTFDSSYSVVAFFILFFIIFVFYYFFIFLFCWLPAIVSWSQKQGKQSLHT